MVGFRARLVAGIAAFTVIASGLGTSAATAPAASAATSAVTPWTVSGTADGTGSCTSTTKVCTTLRAAVNAAAAGETVALQNATFTVSSAITISRGITISGVAAQPVPAANATIVDGGNTTRVFIVNSSGVTIDGVVIARGKAGNQDGGGILVNSSAALTLSRSTVMTSTGSQGAGMENNGTATVTQSTFAANTATQKGGAIYNAGNLTVTDSTLDGNGAKGGGGVASASTANLKSVTITNNTSNNSNGGGLYRNGGTFNVSGSIIAGNNASSARDCYGSPSFSGYNIVQFTSGCNPSGSVLVNQDPLLGPLADNAGPTQTRIPLKGSSPATTSPAIDAYSGPCATPTDQRNVTRPNGPKCDIGAVELATLGIDVTLQPSTTTIKAGTGAIDAKNVPTATLLPTPASLADAVIRNAVIRNAVIRNADTSFAVIRNAVIRNAVIRNAVIRNAVIRNAVIRNAVIRNADAEQTLLLAGLTDPLRTVHLSDVPLVRPGGWPTYLQTATVATGETGEGQPAAQVPLQSLALGTKIVVGGVTKTIMRAVEDDGITMDELDLTQVLGFEPVAALLLSKVPMNKIPLTPALAAGTDATADQARLDAWCAALKYSSGPAQDPCRDLGAQAANATPLTVAMAGYDMSGATVNGVFQGISLNDILVKDVAGQKRTGDLNNPGWLELLRLKGYVTTTAVGTITVADAPASWFTGGTRPTPTTQTLRSAIGSIDPNVSLDQLFTDAGGPSLTSLVSQFTMGDLIQGLLPPDTLPWNNLDVGSQPLQAYVSPSPDVETFNINVTISGGPGSTTANIVLPPGFVPTTFDASGKPVVTVDGSPVSAAFDTTNPNKINITAGSLGVGVHVIAVPTYAGIDLGTVPVTASATATSGSLSASDSDSNQVTVVESLEAAGAGTCTSTNGVPADYLPCDSLGTSNGMVYEGHISTPTDRDIYYFTVADNGNTRTRASISLANIAPGRDFDLALFGPPTALIRNAPNSSVAGVPDTAYDVYGNGTTVAPDSQSDVPARPPAALGCSLSRTGTCATIATSFQRNSTEETIDTGRLAPGTYYIQVSGYNGDTSDLPYTVRVRTSTEQLASCPARTNLYAASAPLPDVEDHPLNGSSRVLFLVPQHRLLDTYPADPADPTKLVGSDVIAKTRQLANAVGGTILAVDNTPAAAQAYSNWDAAPCDADIANAVVSEIGKQIDAVTRAYPGYTYDSVVVVGDDNAIPMARIVDRTQIANEASYGASLQSIGAGGARSDNQISRPLSDGYYLSDNAYGTTAGIDVDTHEVLVPDMSIGRLVETPAEIVAAMNEYLDPATKGELDASTAQSGFVTGEDFMKDTATAVAAALTANRLPQVDASLNNDTWTASDLRAALLTAASGPGITSLNGHFDQTRLLGGDGKSIVDSKAFQTAVTSYTRRLLFSMGCHSGLTVSDVSVGAQLDWAQALAGQKGATYAGNSGFGYGDTETLALSERLVKLYAQKLDGSLTVGRALTNAKQQYVATALVMTPYDEKVIQEMNFFGLPFYKLAGSNPVDRPVRTVAPALAGPTGPTTTPVTVDLSIGATSGPNTLRLVSATNGSYYEIGGETLNVQDRPIQPLKTIDVSQAGSRAHGFLITQLTSNDIDTQFDPAFARPTVDNSTTEQLLSGMSDAVFPASIARVGHTTTAPGGSDVLVLAGGQARDPNPAAGTVTQRVFTHIGGLVSRSTDDTDWTAPDILQSSGEIVNATAGFVVDAATDATRVFVLYKPRNATVWKGIDLTQSGAGIGGSNRWWGGGNVPAGTTSVEFLVQVGDSAGNWGFSTNKVTNFQASKVTSSPGVAISVSPSTPASGWYQSGPVTASISGTNVSYSIDGGPLTPYTGTIDMFALGEGVHHLVATNGAGGIDAIDVAIDTTAVGKPSIAGTIDPGTRTGPVVANGYAYYNGAVNLVLTATDPPKGSGIKSIRYSTNGGGTYTTDSNPVVAPTGTATSTVNVGSTATYDPYTATDFAGNTSANGGPTAIGVDGAAPVFTCAPPSLTAYYRNNVSVPCTVADAGVGLMNATDASVTLTAVVGTDPSVLTVKTGIVNVCDKLGNCVDSPQYQFNVDITMPTITITTPANGAWYSQGQVVNANYSCGDTQSGVVSCVGTVANGSPIDTTGAVTSVRVDATDAAGNTFSVTRTYGIDTIKPSISITSPVATTYPATPAVTASYTCTDNESGITLANCVGTVANGAAIDLSPGSHTFTVNAADNAGNTATQSVTYIAGFQVCLQYDPTQAQSRTGTVVVKLKLCDGARNNLSSNGIALTATCVMSGNDTQTPAAPQFPCPIQPSLNFQGNSNSGFQFRYSAGQYIYNLDPTKASPPLAGGPFTMFFTVSSTPGIQYKAWFTLR